MSNHSITVILNRLRAATTDEERQAAAAALYRCYRGKVEQVARGRLNSGPGLADEEDIAQSAFRSFFDRIETGQLDALVNGGQAWAILSRLTRNKAIDSVRYENAMRRGGDGGRRAPADATATTTNTSDAPFETPAGQTIGFKPAESVTPNGQTANGQATNSPGSNEPPAGVAPAAKPAAATTGLHHDELPLDAVRDLSQRPGDEHAASNEAVERFLEQLSEATLRGIVALKMEGFTNAEIAEKIGCATRTVERKLNLIRRLWIPILEESDEKRRS